MSKKIEPNEERQAGIGMLVDFFSKQADGSRLSWLEIQTGSGVITTGTKATEGREWARRALHKIKRAYVPIGDGLGVELSAPENAVSIAAHRTRRIVGEAKAAHKSVTATLDRHADQLRADDRELLRANRSVTGALVEMSKGASKAFKLAPKTTALPQLPRGVGGE